MMNRNTGNGGGGRPGFTIVELMVVVSLIALLLGFSVPLVFKIDELSRDRSGVNTFGVAVTAARAYATRRIADPDGLPNAEYSGAAILVTPMNELRIIGDMLDSTMETSGTSGFYYDLQTSRMETIAMPRGVGVVGITRSAANAAGVFLLPPPFVIRFNRHGQLMTETRTWATDAGAKRNLVYFDAGHDGGFGNEVVRPGSSAANPAGTYSPKAYDPDAQAITSQWNAGRADWNLPFGVLESVVGVIVYSKADFEDAGGFWPATAPTLGCTGGCGAGMQGITKWMLENGTTLFFSRNTGNVMRRKIQ